VPKKSRFKDHDVPYHYDVAGQVTSSGTWPMDSPWALSYRLSIGTIPLSGLVSEIFSDKNYYMMTSSVTSQDPDQMVTASCLPLLNIIGELLCLTLPALFILAFSTPAQLYFIFPHLHFPSLHSHNWFFHIWLLHPPPWYLIFPYLHCHTPRKDM